MDALPSMEQMLGQHVKLKTVKKIGEGTFAEAFKGSDVVFKIMPMEGKLLVSHRLCASSQPWTSLKQCCTDMIQASCNISSGSYQKDYYSTDPVQQARRQPG